MYKRAGTVVTNCPKACERLQDTTVPGKKVVYEAENSSNQMSCCLMPPHFHANTTRLFVPASLANPNIHIHTEIAHQIVNTRHHSGVPHITRLACQLDTSHAAWAIVGGVRGVQKDAAAGLILEDDAEPLVDDSAWCIIVLQPRRAEKRVPEHVREGHIPVVPLLPLTTPSRRALVPENRTETTLNWLKPTASIMADGNPAVVGLAAV